LAGATPFPILIGFCTDIAGATNGFLESFGVQSTIDDLMGLRGITTPVQNLLGINNAFDRGGILDG
jgi:hypothetical protein